MAEPEKDSEGKSVGSVRAKGLLGDALFVILDSNLLTRVASMLVVMVWQYAQLATRKIVQQENADSGSDGPRQNDSEGNQDGG